MAVRIPDLVMAIDAGPIAGDQMCFPVGPRLVPLAFHAPHLEVAPTELAAILLSDCYKDFAPEELRCRSLKARTCSPSKSRIKGEEAVELVTAETLST